MSYSIWLLASFHGDFLAKNTKENTSQNSLYITLHRICKMWRQLSYPYMFETVLYWKSSYICYCESFECTRHKSRMLIQSFTWSHFIASQPHNLPRILRCKRPTTLWITYSAAYMFNLKPWSLWLWLLCNPSVLVPWYHWYWIFLSGNDINHPQIITRQLPTGGI